MPNTGTDNNDIFLGSNDKLYKIGRPDSKLYGFQSNAWVLTNGNTVNKYSENNGTTGKIYGNGMLWSNGASLVNSRDVSVGFDGTLFLIPSTGSTKVTGSLI